MATGTNAIVRFADFGSTKLNYTDGNQCPTHDSLVDSVKPGYVIFIGGNYAANQLVRYSDVSVVQSGQADPSGGEGTTVGGSNLSFIINASKYGGFYYAIGFGIDNTGLATNVGIGRYGFQLGMSGGTYVPMNLVMGPSLVTGSNLGMEGPDQSIPAYSKDVEFTLPQYPLEGAITPNKSLSMNSGTPVATTWVGLYFTILVSHPYTSTLRDSVTTITYYFGDSRSFAIGGNIPDTFPSITNPIATSGGAQIILYGSGTNSFITFLFNNSVLSGESVPMAQRFLNSLVNGNGLLKFNN